jgi:hypothetical protein
MKSLIASAMIFFSLLCSANEENNATWNKERNAVAFCLYENESKCYIIKDEITINVSQVENTNIEKLGIAKKETYEKVITMPVKWTSSDNAVLIVSFKTEAWLAGKKYTAIEPVAIKNGEYIQR